ncbi:MULTISPECIES: PspA/IM30 family protein [Paenibacillus]|nr:MULTISPECIES: PspA/IM30 family protein [Paenibacillus]
MTILSRFRDIMAANVNAWLDRSKDPEKTIKEYMQALRSDLGQVKAETESQVAQERRAKRALDEGQADVRKLQRYAEKAAMEGKDEDALKFLERKALETEKLAPLQEAYDAAASNLAKMKEMEAKLVKDIGQLEARYAELKGKLAAAKSQQELNERGAGAGGAHAALSAMEEKASLALNEALALAELRGGAQEDDLDDLIAQLEKEQRAGGSNAGPDAGVNAGTGSSSEVDGPKTMSAEDELAALKARLNPKE